jgi:hypothetical protein
MTNNYVNNSTSNKLKLTSTGITVIDDKIVTKENKTELVSENKEKSYDEDYNAVYHDEPLTPYGVISYDDLDAAVKYRELQTAYEIALGQFIEMADRIIKGYYYEENATYSYDDKLNKLKKLTSEFINRIEKTYLNTFVTKEYSATLNINDIVYWDYPGDNGYGKINNIKTTGEFVINDKTIKASISDPVYEIVLFSKQKDGSFSESDQIKLKIAADIIKLENNDIIIKENSGSENNLNVLVETPTFSLIKSNEQLFWIGVPTNKYLDKDGEIIASYAHQEFVKEVNEGNEEFPELWVWHIEKAVGTTDFLEYDERGFVLAGGTILKEYQDLVEKIVTNAIAQGDVLGMSHQMVPGKTYMQGNVYTKYVSKEFSLLPVKHAANELTGFAL